MAKRTNFLLARGESLTEPVTVKKGSGEKKLPYTFSEAKKFLAPRAKVAAEEVMKLPAVACPDDAAVGAMTLHPTFTAKSYFPQDLLDAIGLELVGTKSVTIKPRKWAVKNPPESAVAPLLFVAGPRAAFRRFADVLPKLSSDDEANQLVEVEDFRAVLPEERLQPFHRHEELPLLEVVLHVLGRRGADYSRHAFAEFLKAIGIDYELRSHVQTKHLVFQGIRCPVKSVTRVTQFSLVRSCREMPELRSFLDDGTRGSSSRVHPGFIYDLPETPARDAGVSVAIIDGGLPDDRRLRRWVKLEDVGDVGARDNKWLDHGLAVTSAFLFGPMRNAAPNCESPVCNVTHYRVLDAKTEPQDDLYDVLERVVTVLSAKKHDLANLSIGPQVPIDDDDINGWTAKIDDCLADGHTLLTVAVGNDGEADATLRFNRIQPPSDCVNALSVGACSSDGPAWARAAYSCVGPGRSPGLVKPDMVAFGGADGEPFFVMSQASPNEVVGRCGTSFAAPTALRLGASLRVHFGAIISSLAIKCLLLHRCEPLEGLEHEVGRGRPANDVAQLVTCGPGVVTTIFQGTLDPKKYLRAPIPFPVGKLGGRTTIRATICYATLTDSKDPFNYTRSGVEVVFRPHSAKFNMDKKAGKRSQHAKTRSFFSGTGPEDEASLRADSHKWETVLHAHDRINSSGLKDPVFDLHYNPREGGADTNDAPPIPYAMVVTTECSQCPDLFDRVVTRYPGLLVELKPVVEIQVKQ